MAGDEMVLRLAVNPAQKLARECVSGLFERYPQGPFRGTIWLDEHAGYAEISAFDGALHVGGVFVLADERKKGHGTAIMKVLMDAADEAGLRMTLTAKPFSSGGKKMAARQLTSWYKSLGFVRDGDDMVRPPTVSATLDDIASGISPRSANTETDAKPCSDSILKLR